jgi:hypothetical protein
MRDENGWFVASTPPPPEKWAQWMCEAMSLMYKGYRRTSRRSGIVTRIDRPDWRDHISLPQGVSVTHPEDHYRRVISRDSLRVSKYVSEMVYASHDREHECGYIKPGDISSK